jgi:hypothetical protein
LPVPEHGTATWFGDSAAARFAIEQGVFPELAGAEAVFQDRHALTALHSEARALIGEVSPPLDRLLRLVVTDVVFVSSTRIGGGSGSHLPGLIGVSPDPGWEPLDLAECLVHEATHLNTFICDMLYGLYLEPSSRLEREECRVLSAVRVGERRPLDKALHSALVAVPLMYLEHLLGKTLLVEQFSHSLRDCCDGLLDRQRFFSPYGQAVVLDLAAFVESFDYGSVDRSLGMSDEECLFPVAALA